MKIPLYTSQARPSGEAPGRSFSARMQAEPFIRAEIEKGNTFGAAASQIAEFADMRYKMAREAKLNDALIAADEQLREETRSLADSKDIYNVLDGDDPHWNKNVEGIRNTLRSQLGKDREALRIFDEQFKKSEITQRFRLRGVVDTKIEQRIQAQRKRKLETAEDNSVAAATIDDIFLNLSDIKIDGARTAQVLKANPDALDGQQAVLLKNITKRRMQILLDNSENPIATMSILRTAALSGDTSGLTDPRLGGKGLVEAELLSMMPLADRISILSGGETLAKYVDGPTLEEEAIREKAAASLRAVSSEATEVLSLLEKNIPVSDAQIDGIEVALNKLSSTLPPDQVLPVQEVLTDARDFKKFKDEILQVGATPQRIQEVITEIESKPDLGSEDVKYLSYASKLLTSTVDAIEKDPIAWAQSTGNIGDQPLDLSFSDPAETARQFKVRVLDANRVHALSGRGAAGAEFRLLSEAEENALVENFQNGPLSQKMSVLMGLQAAFDTGTPKSQELLQDMYVTIADKEPLMAHAGGLIAMGRQDAAREILQGLEQIKSGVVVPLKTNAGFAVKDIIAKNLQEALRFQPQATDAINKATEAILANRFIGKTETDLTEKAVIEAMQTAAGQYKKNNEVFGGIQLVNNAATFIPKDRTVDRFEETMDNLTPDFFKMMGYEISPALWNQVLEGDWTFQVAGDGQYRIMKDQDGVNPVPQFLNGYRTDVASNAPEPVLIDYYLAEKLLQQNRASLAKAGLYSTFADTSYSMFGKAAVPEGVREDVPAEGAFLGAEPMVSPDIVGRTTKRMEAKGNQLYTEYLQRTVPLRDSLAEAIPPQEFETIVAPFADTVPDSATNEEYVAYIDAVFGGFRKSFKDWKASQ